MVAQHHLHARRLADESVAAQDVGPRAGPLEVGGVVARGEERAHRLAGGLHVVGRSARQGHGLVQQRHAFGDPPRLHVGQAGVGESLGLEVHVAEPAGPVEGQLGAGEQRRRVVHVAAQRCHRHPPLLDARGLVLDQAGGPQEPRPARGQVAHEVGEQVTEPGAGQGGPTPVAGGGEAPDGGGQVGRRTIDVGRRHGLLGQLHLPNGVVGDRRHDDNGRTSALGPGAAGGRAKGRQGSPGMRAYAVATSAGLQLST